VQAVVGLVVVVFRLVNSYRESKQPRSNHRIVVADGGEEAATHLQRWEASSGT